MAKESVDVLIEGGKATAAPPLGPALGPLGVNIGQIVVEINKKTADFKGMKVPVKVIVDKDTKEFQIKIGTPPASQLIKKEAGIAKGASNPKTDMVADLKMEQIVKVAKMKSDSLLGKDNVEKAKEILGTCSSMGVMVEGKRAQDTIEDIRNGKFRDQILAGKTELSSEELKEQAEEKKKLQKDLEERREEYEKKAKEILAKMQGKSRAEMKTAMVEAKLPSEIIEHTLPKEEKKEAKGKGDKKK